jgi:lysozyme
MEIEIMLLGVDVSHHQGQMDWSRCRAAGARFAFIRAGIINTFGQCQTDRQFERNARLAPDYLPIGFYWYMRPQFPGKDQANYFCSLIRDKRYKLPPVMDLESSGGKTPIEVTKESSSFLRQVYARINVWSLLYSRALWLNDNTISDPVWAMVGLFIARYKQMSGPWADGKCIPRDFITWDFWQHSADGNGMGSKFGAKSRAIDLVYFNGDQSDFDLYIGAAVSPHLVKVTSMVAASVRSGPEGPAIGATWRGAVWPVNEISIDGKYYKVEGWIDSTKVEKI